MTNLEGRITRLRAPEPADLDRMYAWENDPALWPVSGTMAPFSRHTLKQFIEGQGFDLLQTRQQRLMIDTLREGKTVGAIDLFEYDPIARRAGVGILIYGSDQRGRGYASDAVETVCHYGRETLHLHQLWCNVGADNIPSMELFRKAGFEAVGIKRDWLWTPEGYRDEILMQKIL